MIKLVDVGKVAGDKNLRHGLVYRWPVAVVFGTADITQGVGINKLVSFVADQLLITALRQVAFGKIESAGYGCGKFYCNGFLLNIVILCQI